MTDTIYTDFLVRDTLRFASKDLANAASAMERILIDFGATGAHYPFSDVIDDELMVVIYDVENAVQALKTLLAVRPTTDLDPREL